MTRSLPFHKALIFAVVVACGSVATTRSSAADEPIRFSRDVLPILSDNCFQCHGPDQAARQADLRLDTEAGVLGGDKPVVVKGKSAESELLRRILSTDPDEVMPPPKTGRKITPQQMEVLRKWIDSGAEWGKHWAFDAPQRPTPPEIANPAFPIRNPIDAWILARLNRDGIAPSPEAPRETLIRRLSLDLTGLPPTPEEIDAFLADTSPTAYEALVDRLLASPRFGERMVWEWLDAARYADTNGYQGDPTRTMYFWRDWVIDALNRNMPFDQFTIEQLAGDLLPNPTQAQLVATGFHRNHMINGEGGRIAEESRVDYVQDRVETTGTVWMGLTLNCCRCHDHKFDPILQREYYQLSAYFNSIDETGANDAAGMANPVLSLALPEQQQKIEALRTAEREAVTARDALEKQLPELQAAWERSLLTPDGKLAEAAWEPLVASEAKSEQGTDLVPLEDGSLLAEGKNPAKDTYRIVTAPVRGPITGLRLEAIPDDSLANKGPGRADNGNFVLSEIQVQVNDKPVELVAVKADFEQGKLTLATALDGKPDTGWAVMPEFGKPHTAVVSLKTPLESVDATPLTISLQFQHGERHTLGRFRLSTTSSPAALLAPLNDELRETILKPAANRSEEAKRKLAEHYKLVDAQWIAAMARADATRRERDAFERSQPRTMVMRERAQPRETFILVRGAYDKFAEKVSHGVPGVLPALPTGAETNRLALARWLVSAEHPLTARVTVNRYWQWLFGTGLVKTAEDFGVQGEKPTHPELLDWLACEFRQPTVPQPSVANDRPDNAWNTKHILRLIVTSSTYRQSSKITPALAERDPDNRLLGRGPRYRLPSWMIRDQALAASGLLVEKVGGAPVKGYQPPGIWEEATFGNIRYQQDQGEALYRRSLYQFWRRIVGPTMFFDVAARQTCQVKIARTNTPLQALVTLNDVTYVEAARALAQRVLLEGSAAPEQRVERIYCLTVGRRPSAAEQKVLLAAIARLREQYAADPEAAKKLLTTGESKRNETLDPIEHAAYTALCNTILNLDETLSKE